MSDPIRNPFGGGVLDENSHGAQEIVMELRVRVHASGALSVLGPIEHKEYALALLENAKDAIRNHHARRAGNLIVPSEDVSISKI